MTIYRLIPVAPDGDEAWRRFTNQGTIVVRASSTGEARAVAIAAEAIHLRQYPEVFRHHAGSALKDERLYAVLPDMDWGLPQDGPAGLLYASFYSPVDLLDVALVGEAIWDH